MKFIYLAIVTALLGLVLRMVEGYGPAAHGPAAAHDVPGGAQTVVMVILKTNQFFSIDEYHQNYSSVENSGCIACGIVPLPTIDLPDLKK